MAVRGLQRLGNRTDQFQPLPEIQGIGMGADVMIEALLRGIMIKNEGGALFAVDEVGRPQDARMPYAFQEPEFPPGRIGEGFALFGAQRPPGRVEPDPTLDIAQRYMPGEPVLMEVGFRQQLLQLVIAYPATALRRTNAHRFQCAVDRCGQVPIDGL